MPRAFPRPVGAVAGKVRTATSRRQHRSAAAQLARRSNGNPRPRRCDGSRASVGPTVTLIPVQDIDFLRAEEK